jgi:hypothetical protein
MAVGTARVVNATALCLLRVQAQLGVGLAGLGVAAGEKEDGDEADRSREGNPRAPGCQRCVQNFLS